ncbi:gliding motility lipoprotein GldH [Neptunitalea chrysea]|uniref:Gliding motility lipoprotein GldH n=1 Tax=Neptunitalea chrysea TaxID=1647581 RepID=A0A9W6B9D3_9FLAO|nr:gliding motility lipoprotein GldH [Neptunitalea chrysea]GLB54134.1 gliding motility lipoprotein GldH [Neptunitalea chrysea]
MHRIAGRLLVVLSCLALFVSCDKNTVYTEFKSVDGNWSKNDTVSFAFTAPDTVNAYNMYVNLRNNEEYAYSNLYLIVELNYPNGKVDSDTLQYEMAKPDGEWLGKGFSSVKENKLWYKGYKEKFSFTQGGDYTVDILHAMRVNGSINGVLDLDGVTDVGVSIEKIKKE